MPSFLFGCIPLFKLLLRMCYKILCNLHGIESRTLLYLVTYNPHHNTIWI